jgi:hypothetical protein
MRMMLKCVYVYMSMNISKSPKLGGIRTMNYAYV